MLETERLRLRDYTEEDFEFLYALTSNPEVVRYIGIGEVYTREQTKAALGRMFKLYEKNQYMGLKVLELKDRGTPIGQAGFLPQTVEGVDYMEIGYWIAEEHWRNGYATEIATALRTFGEQQLHLDEIISLVQVGNKGSRKVAEENGMQIKKTVNLKGKDVYVFSTLKK
ncbi:GNAT family N-acetyltransferase [Marinilactibacillus sp. Marseille-P9653]|uniref:GNAT family N-acetyltransferase n=1 Tax=Marinilactibacillus sp. Marseille-P9653 TaxID=2866583 RepID=UPI001CE49624|nr:GNAT family N-acetyltransferase [Marinilactibacillus sp. Marseille-P9653]